MVIILLTLFHLGRIFEQPHLTHYYFDPFHIFGNGWVGVGIFFVISGYCMAASVSKRFAGGLSKRIYSIYFLNRLMRIGFPYYVSILFWIIVINGLEVVVKPTGLNDIVTHLLFIHTLDKDTFFSISGVYWTLGVEMQFYLILPLIIFAFRNIKSAGLLVLFTFLLSLFIHLFSTNLVLSWGILAYLCLFLSGAFVFYYQQTIRSLISRFRLINFLWLIWILLLLSKGSHYDNNLKLYEMAVSVLSALILAYYAGTERQSECNKLIHFMAFIGKCSFSIYLYNYVMYIFMPESKTIVSFIQLLLMTFLFGIFMYFAVERPCESFRKRINMKFLN